MPTTEGVFFAVWCVTGLLGQTMHLLVIYRLKRMHRESWIELGSQPYFGWPSRKYRNWRQHGVHKRLGDARLSMIVSIANLCVVLLTIMALCVIPYAIAGAFANYY